MNIILYYPRQNANNITVTKFTDGDFVQTYTITGTASCDCPGATHHQTQCKHLRIVKAWKQMGKPAAQAFIVDKRGVITTEIG